MSRNNGGSRIAEIITNKFRYPPHLSILTEETEVAIREPMSSDDVTAREAQPRAAGSSGWRCDDIATYGTIQGNTSIHTRLSFCTEVMVLVTWAEPSSMTW